MKQTIEQQIQDWKQSCIDQVDTLCAVYKCADIKPAFKAIAAADSVMDMLLAMLVHATENDIPDKLEEVVIDAKALIASEVIGLLCVPDDKLDTLTNDIVRILDTRYALENRLNEQ